MRQTCRWVLLCLTLCMFAYCSVGMYNAIENSASIKYYVKVKFEPPPETALYIGGVKTNTTVFLSTKSVYEISYRKQNGKIVQSFSFSPSSAGVQ